ncbi:13302_t:CDS:2 [Cetraspora pellucida]|uniref:13302_t:CDS:1 n=1 Tax=Cetraspora pellucida TaxID=1433469 RepID=A0A9N9DES1_9GLOM|nr:13302_t:CDS:2 [Cetraspora pellucida]
MDSSFNTSSVSSFSISINTNPASVLQIEERKASSSKRSPIFMGCCAEGKVILPSLQDPPPILYALLTSTNARARNFHQRIRSYNSALAFTSIGANIDDSVTSVGGVYMFRIHGKMYHNIGSLLLAQPGASPHFAQIYVYDTEHKLQNRMNVMPSLDASVLADLQQMLDQVNPYVTVFRQVRNKLTQKPATTLSMIIRADRTADLRRYNISAANEVAAILVGNEHETEPSHRDIVLSLCNGTLQRISELHRSYILLHYVLLFPRGEDDSMCDDNESSHIARHRFVTLMQFYAYRLHVRIKERSGLHLADCLFQQYIVNTYAVIEQNWLNFLKSNQKKICTELYQGLQDVFQTANVQQGGEIGQRIVLPSTFMGGP